MLALAPGMLGAGSTDTDTATATAAPKILLVVEGEPGALFKRLHAELEQLGFQVRAEQKGGTSLADRAKRVGANAALRVPRSRQATEVWVADPEGDRSVLREVLIAREGAQRGRADDAVIATRAVELLRASFLEIDLEMPEPVSEPVDAGPPPSEMADAADGAPAVTSATPDEPPAAKRPTIAAAATPTAPRGTPENSGSRPTFDSPRQLHELRLNSGVAASVSPGGVPADGHLLLGLSLDVAPHFTAGGVVLSPSLLSQIDGSEGRARVHVSLLLGELTWSSDAPVEPVLGFGVGAAWLLTSGDPEAGFDGHTDGALVGLGVLRAGLGWQAGQLVRLTADARLAFAASDVSVRFDQREAAAWGRPLALFSAGIEVGLD